VTCKYTCVEVRSVSSPRKPATLGCCQNNKYARRMNIYMRVMYIYSSWPIWICVTYECTYVWQICVPYAYTYAWHIHLQFVTYMYMCDIWIYMCMNIHKCDIYVYSSWRICICVTYENTYVWQIYSSWPIFICVRYEYTCVWYINMQFVTHMYTCDIWIYICVTK